MVWKTVKYLVILVLLYFVAGLYQERGLNSEGATSVLTNEISNIDKINLLSTVVSIDTMYTYGSGVIVDKRLEDGYNVYTVFTASHILNGRFNKKVVYVDGLTGLVRYSIIDTGCRVNIQDETIPADIIYESDTDLGVLSFRSLKDFNVTNLATQTILDNVKIFDDVISIGCQINRNPQPSIGIISQITMNGTVYYGHTSQLAPGSSGGGLFIYNNGEYYLIGIAIKIHVWQSHAFPHLSQSVSVGPIIGLIDSD